MFPLLVLLLTAPARGQESDDPAAMLRSYTAPLQNLAAAEADDVNDPRVASQWALWDLLEDLRQQRAAGAAKPQPSPALVDVYLRMAMRLRAEELRSFGSKP
ncbi:MAG: hypothetical protein HY926_11540, partial [Elusimicrobia bacterium]|nr:hypothetical protein [Elusimicrobiota bacterium]